MIAPDDTRSESETEKEGARRWRRCSTVHFFMNSAIHDRSSARDKSTHLSAAAIAAATTIGHELKYIRWRCWRWNSQLMLLRLLLKMQIWYHVIRATLDAANRQIRMQQQRGWRNDAKKANEMNCMQSARQRRPSFRISMKTKEKRLH